MSLQITAAKVCIYYIVLLREGSVQIGKMKSTRQHGLLLQMLILVEIVLYRFPSSLSPYAPSQAGAPFSLILILHTYFCVCLYVYA